MSFFRRLFLARKTPAGSRIALATLFAPPLGMVVFGIVSPILLNDVAGPGSRGNPISFVSFGLMMVLLGSIFAYIGTIFIVLPIMCLLRKLDLECGLAYLVTGAVALPLIELARSGQFPQHAAQGMLAMMPGAFVAGVWWWIASGDVGGPIVFHGMSSRQAR